MKIRCTSRQQLAMAGEAMVTVTLDEKRDPREYYPIVAVPSTTAIKQTEDIVSDYRGTRTMRLLVEGAWPGRLPGVVVIRHMENLGEAAAIGLPEIAVTE